VIDDIAAQALRAYKHTLGTRKLTNLSHKIFTDFHSASDSDVCVYNGTDLTFDITITTTNSGEYILMYIQGQVTNEVRYLKASGQINNLV
jgi:protease II